jgi:hypothetical protein
VPAKLPPTVYPSGCNYFKSVQVPYPQFGVSLDSLRKATRPLHFTTKTLPKPGIDLRKTTDGNAGNSNPHGSGATLANAHFHSAKVVEHLTRSGTDSAWRNVLAL